jgi:membrane fusion protein, copper/silver efflux system
MQSKTLVLMLGVGLTVVASLAVGARLGTGAWPEPKALLAQWRGADALDAPNRAIAPEAKRVLYYRNPMGAPDTSPVPKKDSMGMDYIPVYEDVGAAPADDAKTVKISLDKVQRSGVRTAVAEPRRLVLPIRAPGKVAIDERTLRMITLRVDGYIDKLYVNSVGQHVKQGEPLFRLFSQEVLAASSLYQATMAGGGARSGPGVDGALRKLTNMGVPESYIRMVGSSAVPPALIEWPSPVSGVVIEKMVIEGERAEPGRALFKIADHTKLWVIADVAEQDADKIRIGSKATLTFRAMPGEPVSGEVSFIYPHLNAETRTAQVRIELANPEGRFRPDMFADVTINAGTGDTLVLAVPVDAVVHSGERTVVILDKGDGRFEPRAVTLGDSGDGYVAVRGAIAAGDKVVTAANFLIDAESNLRAALAAFTQEQKAPGLPPQPKPETSNGAANAAVPQ